MRSIRYEMIEFVYNETLYYVIRAVEHNARCKVALVQTGLFNGVSDVVTEEIVAEIHVRDINWNIVIR